MTKEKRTSQAMCSYKKKMIHFEFLLKQNSLRISPGVGRHIVHWVQSSIHTVHTDKYLYGTVLIDRRYTNINALHWLFEDKSRTGKGKLKTCLRTLSRSWTVKVDARNVEVCEEECGVSSAERTLHSGESDEA